jgi:CheY-like chemotaxis protein
MGGEIWAESEIDRGSEFHFTITCEEVASSASAPRYDRCSRAVWKDSRSSIGKTEPFRVLVAEDNPANRVLAKASLVQSGFQVEEVENGLDAVEALKTRSYHLVLMDCRMPVMDGYLATQMIRQLPSPARHIPIIAITASAFKEDREKALASGMNDFIAKPYQPWELVTKCLQFVKTRPELKEVPKVTPADNFKAELMQVFLESAPPVFQQLIDALESQQWDQARAHAHWLQGGAARMLNPELQQKLSETVARCREASPVVSELDIQALRVAFVEAIRLAKTYLGVEGSAGTIQAAAG